MFYNLFNFFLAFDCVESLIEMIGMTSISYTVLEF